MSDEDVERLTKDATEYKGLVQALRTITDQEKALSERKKVIKQTLSEYLGDAEVGVIDGRPAFRYLKSYPKRLDQAALKDARPEVFAAFITEREARTFTLVEEI